MRSLRPRAAVLAIAALVCVLLPGPSFAASPHAVGPADVRAAPAVAVVPGASNPLPHSALTATAPAPSAATPPGEQFGAEYEVQVPNYTSALGTAAVAVPNSLVRIPTSSGSIHLFLDGVNMTVTGTGPVEAGAVPLTRLPAAVTFNSTGWALLSSQGLAVMASWPYGGPAVEFRWHWTSVGPDGSTGAGPWSNWTGVEPAELATLEGPIERSWAVGAPYELCLGGALAGRTFAVHVATTSPASQIDASSATGPSGGPARLCWNSTVPAATAPQAAVVHVWETDNTTFLLYVFGVQLTGSSSSSGPPSASGQGPSPATIGVGVAAVVAALLIGYVFVVRPRTRHRAAPAEPPPLAADPPSRGRELPPPQP